MFDWNHIKVKEAALVKGPYISNKLKVIFDVAGSNTVVKAISAPAHSRRMVSWSKKSNRSKQSTPIAPSMMDEMLMKLLERASDTQYLIETQQLSVKILNLEESSFNERVIDKARYVNPKF